MSLSRLMRSLGVSFLLVGILLGQPSDARAAPDKGNNLSNLLPGNNAMLPGFADFAASLRHNGLHVPAGVYVPGVLALPITQQPRDNPAFVSTQDGVVTQFSLANSFGSIGLLAHNTLSGRLFYDLDLHQILYLAFADGTVRYYMITSVLRYQALSPNSPYSNFVNLSRPNERLTSSELFERVFTTQNSLVFQTCIAKDGEPSWGRVFVIAKQIDPQAAQFGMDPLGAWLN